MDPVAAGDGSPRLFVYHWVMGTRPVTTPAAGSKCLPLAFRGCSSPLVMCRSLDAIAHFGGAWWVGYQGEWIGNFPDVLVEQSGLHERRPSAVVWRGGCRADAPQPDGQRTLC